MSSPCQRLFRDIYVHVDVAVTHTVLRRAVELFLPPGAAISGASAAHLHGANVLKLDAPVEVTVPPQLWIAKQPRLTVRYSELRAGDVDSRAGVPTTTPVRTGFDLARWSSLEDAVVSVDALLTSCGLRIEEIANYANDGRSCWRGVGRLARVLSLAAAGAESPMETRPRLVLVRAGLPAPALQFAVWAANGTPVARLDLAYVHTRLGIEYDGECHWEPRAVRKDLLRQNALRAVGWTVLRFTADDVLRHPGRVVAQVRSALRY